MYVLNLLSLLNGMKQNWSMKHVLHVQNTEVSVFRRLLIYRRQSVVVGGKQICKLAFILRSSTGFNFGSSLISHLHWWCNQWSILSWNSYSFLCRWYSFVSTISSNSDYTYLQLDASRVNCNHMFLNSSKCKFMLISRKRNTINNPPTTTINGQILESVPGFKY